MFCEDHISDQCGCRDDGSGQYVTDLGAMLCDECHQNLHAGIYD